MKDEVDLFELNEAFAAQSLAVITDLGLNHSKVRFSPRVHQACLKPQQTDTTKCDREFPGY